MRLYPIIFAAPAVLLLTSCASSIVTRHVPPLLAPAPVAEGEGIHYFLPKTLVRVTVPVTETTKSPGPYADLAPFFFPGADSKTIITTESSSYTIDPDSISIVTRGVKDLTQQYVLKPTGQIFADTKFHFVMNDQGVPTKISAEIDNHSIDVALTLLESTASLAGKALSGGALGALEKTNKTALAAKTSCPYENEFPAGNKYASLTPRLKDLYCYLSPDDRIAVFDIEPSYAIVLANYLDTELSTVSTDPGALRTPAVHLKVAKFLGARQLYSELAQLLSAGGAILSRDISQTSDTTLKALLDSRRARIKEILTSFFGITEKNPSYWNGSFDADLQPVDAGIPIPMFTLKKDKGICSVTDTISFRLVAARPDLRTDCGGEVRRIQITLVPVEPVIAGALPSGTYESGLRYRLPRSAIAKISDDMSELARQNVSIAQFGQVASLPKKVGGMKTQYDVTFDGATGALLDITVGSSAAINSDLVKRGAGIADTGIGLKQKLDATPAPPTEQQKAEKDRKLKEEQLKILLLQSCLADPTQAGCVDLVKLP